MAPHPERSLLARVAGCLVASVVVAVVSTTAAFAAQDTTKATTAHDRAATQSSVKADHPSQSKADASSASSASDASDHSAGNASTTGDPTQPQPLSGADQNTGGANGQCPDGPYCSTRDGSASGNGNGGGEATGKPCAGCVGKADNKNPPGQMPDASDGNAGYECDTNHGIARTNPAHTGCQSSTPPPCDEATEDCGPPPCDEATEDCGPPPCDEATEDCGPPPCDEATEDCGTPPPPTECVPTAANNFCTEVQGEKEVRTPTSTTPGGAVAGASATQPAAALPFTGTDVGVLLVAASLTLLGGSTLLLMARRRHS